VSLCIAKCLSSTDTSCVVLSTSVSALLLYICPAPGPHSQPAPPDTPEHASALLLFLAAALKQAEQECARAAAWPKTALWAANPDLNHLRDLIDFYTAADPMEVLKAAFNHGPVFADSPASSSYSSDASGGTGSSTAAEGATPAATAAVAEVPSVVCTAFVIAGGLITAPEETFSLLHKCFSMDAAAKQQQQQQEEDQKQEELSAAFNHISNSSNSSSSSSVQANHNGCAADAAADTKAAFPCVAFESPAAPAPDGAAAAAAAGIGQHSLQQPGDHKQQQQEQQQQGQQFPDQEGLQQQQQQQQQQQEDVVKVFVSLMIAQVDTALDLVINSSSSSRQVDSSQLQQAAEVAAATASHSSIVQLAFLLSVVVGGLALKMLYEVFIQEQGLQDFLQALSMQGPGPQGSAAGSQAARQGSAAEAPAGDDLAAGPEGSGAQADAAEGLPSPEGAPVQLWLQQCGVVQAALLVTEIQALHDSVLTALLGAQLGWSGYVEQQQHQAVAQQQQQLRGLGAQQQQQAEGVAMPNDPSLGFRQKAKREITQQVRSVEDRHRCIPV